METIGFDEIIIDGIGNIIGRIGKGPLKIAFDAHIGTVDIGNRSLWKFDPYAGHVKDSKVWGRGVADQKGGMASRLAAARIIKELGLARNCAIYGIGNKYLRELAQYSSVLILSLQDDISHPMQVIADLMTIREYFGQNLQGLKVTISWA